MKSCKIICNFLIISVVSGFQLVNGQANEGTIITTERSDLELLNRLRLEHNMKSREEVSYDRIEGDPFLYQAFVPGRLLLKTGEDLKLNLRYDLYKGEVQFRHKDESYTLINTQSVSSVLIDTLKFVYSGYLRSPGDKSSVENSWFILKKEGKCKLLVKTNLRLQAATPPKPYKEEGIPAKFIRTRDTYYFELQSENAVKIDSKKDILDILADKRDQMSGFITSNKLDIKDVNDLARIVSYYDGL
jgi:hypothetical protein